MDLKDKVVLVAGATNDVGTAISFRLSRAGAAIALADSDKAKLASIEERIKSAGGKAGAWEVTMGDDAEVSRTVQAIADEFGTIDVLVNCMDTPEKQSISGTNMDQWRALIDTNLTAVFLFAKAVIPIMKAKKYGRVITITDFDYLGMPGSSSYSAVKAGIFGFTRALALESARDGITVNSVAKGEIRASNVALSEEQLAAAEKRMPVNKLGTTEDIAYAVSFFASSRSKYVTGQTLFVCGGKSLYASMSV
jgi:NAD(P)-dependent dehydrogenase (short-subunit alcohol dehydrogenase family)